MRCFIINYWADTDEKIDMVINCIKQLKKTGRDIIYTSLYPIDKKISELSKKIFLEDDTQRITMEEAMLKVSIMLKDKAMREDIFHLDNLVEKEPTFKKPGLKF